jgi:hypothetical protein
MPDAIPDVMQDVMPVVMEYLIINVMEDFKYKVV